MSLVILYKDNFLPERDIEIRQVYVCSGVLADLVFCWLVSSSGELMLPYEIERGSSARLVCDHQDRCVIWTLCVTNALLNASRTLDWLSSSAAAMSNAPVMWNGLLSSAKTGACSGGSAKRPLFGL